MKQVKYKGSTVIPTSSSLEMIQVLWAFFPENRDQSVEVSAENTCSEWLHVVYSKFDRL